MSETPTVDWIEKLAARVSEAHSTTTKEERIARRASKKRQRCEALKHGVNGAKPSQWKTSASNKIPSVSTKHSETVKRVGFRERLNYLATSIHTSLQSLPQQRPKLYPSQARGASLKKRKWDEVSLQPRKRDYGGIGLARPSLFIPFEDLSFVPKLEEEFVEHIPGFFGRQKTKVMKKKSNQRMLWKKISETKHSDAQLNGKKLSDMTPNERVEAFIAAGLL